MSGEKGEIHQHHQHDIGFPFQDDLSSIFSQRSGLQDDLHGIDPYASFADYLHGSADYGSLARAFDMSCPMPLPDIFGQPEKEKEMSEFLVDGGGCGGKMCGSSGGGGGGTVTPITPNSSITSSSTEAAGEEDSGRCKKDVPKQEEEDEEEMKQGKDGDGKAKKVNKPRKKGEKRQRQPRYAFMTKSDVDHLEDGYRWRKYGQKAVKNSPYPRSYYRCTTQKCLVKKMVERSFQDPATVITTYEGQHTHYSPATIRGGSHMVPPPPAMPSGFHQDVLMHQLNILSNNIGYQGDAQHTGMYLQTLPTHLPQQLQFQDYGLLQDVVPSFINNIQP